MVNCLFIKWGNNYCSVFQLIIRLNVDAWAKFFEIVELYYRLTDLLDNCIFYKIVGA